MNIDLLGGIKMRFELKNMIRMSLLAALICVASYISFSIGTVPFSAQTLAIMIVGLLLKPKESLMTVSVYILLGAIGLPVYANGTSGVGILFGPTGGYIWGFLLGAIIISYLKDILKSKVGYALAAMIGGVGVIYVCGVIGLMTMAKMPFTAAMIAGVYPFLIGDIIKVIVAVWIAKRIEKQID